MRLRTFLQLLPVFLAGSLASILLLLLPHPGWLDEILGFLVTTITVATMWALRARNQKLTDNVVAEALPEAPSTRSWDPAA